MHRKSFLAGMLSARYYKSQIATLAKSTSTICFALLLAFLFSACGQKGPKVPASSADFAGKNYEDVILELKQAGFSNIETVVIEDLSSKSSISDGAVETVSIGDTENFQAGDTFSPQDKIMVTYHIIKKLNPPLSADEIQALGYTDIQEKFEAAGFVHVYTEEVFDLDPDHFDGEYKNEVRIGGNSSFDTFDPYPFDTKVSIVCHRPYEKYTLQVHVDCTPNLIFNKYDIDIFLDDIKQVTLAHGSDADYSFRVTEGSHTLTFSKPDAPSINGSVTIDAVSTDITASYKLACYSDRVDVKSVYIDRNVVLSEGEIKLLTPASEYRFKDYKDVEAALKGLGFTNIQYNILYDIVFGWTPEGEVSDVTINGANDFTRGMVFPSDAEVIITYHMSEDDDPSNISMPEDNTYYIGKDYQEVEQTFKGLGFTNISCEKVTTSDATHLDGEVCSVRADYEFFSQGGSYKPTDKVQIKYYMVEVPTRTEAPTEAPIETESTSVDYSTNDKSAVKNGNAGVYAYRDRGGQYYVYYIIDFDNGYVYYFTEGNSEGGCIRTKIESGTLNDVLIVTYHDGDMEWSEGLHFRWKNQPDHLIVQDEDGFEWDYYTTNLEDALALRDAKTIKDY